MDKTFFRSREFVISAVIVTCLLGGALAVAGAPNDVRVVLDGHCPAYHGGGQTVTPAIEDGGIRPEGRGAAEVVSYRVDPSQVRAVRIDICNVVGTVSVVPGDGDEVLLRVHTHNEGGAGAADAVRKTDHEVVFVRDGDTLAVHVWVDRLAAARSFLEARSTHITIDLMVPPGVVVHGVVETDVGDIDVSGVHLGALDATIDVGTIELRPLSVRGGPWDLRTDVGEVVVRAPADDDVGYDIVAEADVGSIDVAIGPTQRSDHKDRDPPGESAHYTTAGYDAKTIRVPVSIDTDVGDILFQTI